MIDLSLDKKLNSMAYAMNEIIKLHYPFTSMGYVCFGGNLYFGDDLYTFKYTVRDEYELISTMFELNNSQSMKKEILSDFLDHVLDKDYITREKYDNLVFINNLTD